MIHIENLTKKQAAIMDILWTIQSIEEVRSFISSLPSHRDRCDATSMMQIAVVDTLEQEGALDEYAKAASYLIHSCR